MPTFAALSWWAKALIILAIAALVYWAVGHTYESIKQAGIDQAHAEDAKVIKAKDDALAEKDRQIAAANDAAHKAKEDADARVRAAEKIAATNQAAIEAEAAGKVKDAQARSDKLVDDLLAGRVRLRDPNADTVANTSGLPGGQLPGTAAGADGRGSGGACELSAGTSADLARLADRADHVAIALAKYKKLAKADRALCNGAAPAASP